MRELTQNEVAFISGGIKSNGYDLKFIIENTAYVGLVATPFALILNNLNIISGSMIVTAALSTGLVVANVVDNAIFN